MLRSHHQSTFLRFKTIAEKMNHTCCQVKRKRKHVGFPEASRRGAVHAPRQFSRKPRGKLA
jgi:hypothetical protein